MDWRKKGAATEVHDQGPCGSCWAFATIATVERITQLTIGKLISLSEQELLDCNWNSESQGCDGGDKENAFNYIVKNIGINSENGTAQQCIEGSVKTTHNSCNRCKL